MRKNKMFSRVARRQLAAQQLPVTKGRTNGTGRLFSTTVSRQADFAHVVSRVYLFGWAGRSIHDGFEVVVEVSA